MSPERLFPDPAADRALEELLRAIDREPPPPRRDLASSIEVAFATRLGPAPGVPAGRETRARRLFIPELVSGVAAAAACLVLWWSREASTAADFAPSVEQVAASSWTTVTRWQADAARRHIEGRLNEAALLLLGADLERVRPAAAAPLVAPRSRSEPSEPDPPAEGLFRRGLEQGARAGLNAGERVAATRLALLRSCDPDVVGREYLARRCRDMSLQHAGTRAAERAARWAAELLE